MIKSAEIGQYNEEIKQFNRVLQALKTRLAEVLRKTTEIMKPEPYQPSVMENIQVFQDLRKAG